MSRRNMICMLLYWVVVLAIGWFHLVSRNILTFLFILFWPLMIGLGFIKYFYFTVGTDELVIKSPLPLVKFTLTKDRIERVWEANFTQVSSLQSLSLPRGMRMPKRTIFIKYKQRRGKEFIQKNMSIELADEVQYPTVLKELVEKKFPVFLVSKIKEIDDFSSLSPVV
ncbi:MAG: hypothetical protein HY569_00710 [Candidatus Magasanikbacteria bacterium]|nr:hypothetical protein [Candidatus Magasanikbacteria bacterium]